MKQHFVQKAYLKGFESKGLLWVLRKDRKKVIRKPAAWCTAHFDFQTPDLEMKQNKIIEHPGIQSLRKLRDKEKISESDIVSAYLWIGLHRIRSTNLKNLVFENAEDYEMRFWEELKTELQYINQFLPFAFIYRPSGCEKLVTSDNPIIETHFDGGRVIFLVLSPDCLLVFSSKNSTFEHQELSVVQIVNAMIWNSADKFVFSNCNSFQINEYEKVCEKWNLKRKIFREQFIVEPVAGGDATRWRS